MRSNICTISKTIDICAAHWLPQHSGKCQYLHGHNYKIDVSLTHKVQPDGMVLDFAILKEAMSEAFGYWDHALLTHWTPSELDEIVYSPEAERLFPIIGLHEITRMIPLGVYSTAENLTWIAMENLLRSLKTKAPWIVHPSTSSTVRIWETPTAFAECQTFLG